MDLDSDDARGADGLKLQSLGKIDATVAAGTRQHATTVHVYDGLSDALLFRQTLRALGFLPPDWLAKTGRKGECQPHR